MALASEMILLCMPLNADKFFGKTFKATVIFLNNHGN